VTLLTMGGVKCGPREMDALLVEVGAVKPNDMRVMKRIRQAEDDEEAGNQRSGIRSSAQKASVEDDDDWD